MTTSIALEEDFEIPLVGSLEGFRQWARSDDFPERGRIDYLAGCIEVDLTPEDYYSHGALKVEVIGVLGNIVKAGDLGDLRSDRTRISAPDAGLSVEPDLVFISYETFDRGGVRLIAKSSGEPDRYVEVERSPDLVVEIVSNRSVTKDTVRLLAAYWQAGVAEYWLLDARGEAPVFHIYRRGPSRYESAPADTGGFQHSGVLNHRFRLSRRRDRRGGWAFDLDQKQAPV